MEENKSIWNGCAISGDISELDKIAESSGIINLDKQDVVDTLDKTGISYVSSAVAASFGQALKMAADALPAPIGESKNLLIQFYFGTRQPMMSELGDVTAMLDSVNGASSVVWGMASDPSLVENCKVVVVASSLSAC